METFQDRMQVAIDRCGGSQSELARRIAERYGVKVSPQKIQFLQSKTRKKPAQGSRITPHIAGVTGLRAEWLASGNGRRDEPVNHEASNLQHAEVLHVRVKETGKLLRMELTKAAIDVARAFMELPANERARFARAIKVAAMQHSEPSSYKAPKRPHKHTAKGTQ